MVGVIDEAMAQPGAQPPPEQMPPEGAPADPAQANPNAATAEEQDTLDRIVAAGAKILYSDKTNKAVMGMLESGAKDPIKAVVSSAEMVMTALDEASKGTLPVDFLAPAADQLMEMIGELATKAGLFEYTEEMHGQAMQQAMQLLAEAMGATEQDVQGFMGSVPPEELEAARSQHQGQEMTNGQPQVR